MGSITGDGLADRQAQATRRDLGLPKRSVKDPITGNWVSYDNLGPVSDWVAMTVTFMENFGSLDSTDQSKWLSMAAHSLSATLTEKKVIQGYAQRNEPENARQFIEQTMQNNGI